MATTLSTSLLILESGKSGAAASSIRASSGELAAVGGDRQGVVVAGIDLLGPQLLVPLHQFLLEVLLLVRHRAGDDDRLAAGQGRPGQVQHLGGLHVGEGAEHLLELRQVRELGEARAGPQRRPVRGDFHRVDHLAEGRRPGVEMLDAAAPEPLRVEEPLHRVHLDHRVGDRRAGGEGDAVAGVLLSQVAGLHVQVKRPFATAGLDAGDAVHLGRRLQVFEVVGLVDEDVIDAQFVEDQPVVLLVLGQQVFQLLLAGGFLLFDGLDEVAVGAFVCRVFKQELVVLGDLLTQEFFLIVLAHADPLEAGVGDDDPVPVTRGDLGGQHLAAVAGQVVLGGDQQPGVRVAAA